MGNITKHFVRVTSAPRALRQRHFHRPSQSSKKNIKTKIDKDEVFYYQIRWPYYTKVTRIWISSLRYKTILVISLFCVNRIEIRYPLKFLRNKVYTLLKPEKFHRRYCRWLIHVKYTLQLTYECCQKRWHSTRILKLGGVHFMLQSIHLWLRIKIMTMS